MGIRVLLATDGSDFSRRAGEFAARLSKVIPMEVHLVQVLDLRRVEYKMLADLYVDMIRKAPWRRPRRPWRRMSSTCGASAWK